MKKNSFISGVLKGAGMSLGTGVVCAIVGTAVAGPAGGIAAFKAGVGFGAAANAGGA